MGRPVDTKNTSGSTTLGFTLIELIVSIGIIAIFATFALAAINPAEQFKKAADSQRKSDLAQIQRALESYYQDNGKYPDDTNGSRIFKIVASVSGVPTTINWGTSWRPYIDVLPKDPNGVKTYVYSVADSGQSYRMYASLDRGGRDPQACNGGNACANLPGGASCGSGQTCNYGVSSPNVSP